MAGMTKAHDLLHHYSGILMLWMLHPPGKTTAPPLISAFLPAQMATNLTNTNLSDPRENDEVVQVGADAVPPQHQILSPS